MPAAKRLFEHGDDGKFWEIWRDGATVFTRFGKLGAKGQTKLKKEAGEPAAEAAIDKQVAEKVRSGFVEKDADGNVVVSRGPALDKTALEQHLKDLTDEASHLVFADWLQSQNHPWGELIVLQHGIATATGDKQRAPLERAAATLLDGKRDAIAGAALHRHTHIAWKLGFAKTLTIGSDATPEAIAEALRAMLALPIAHRVEGVVLNPVPARFNTYRDWGSSDENITRPWGDLAALAKLIPEHILHVGFGGWPAPAASAYVEMPTFTAISEAFRRVERLELTGTAPPEIGRLELPSLVELEVRFANATANDLAAITGSSLGKLERLSIWLGASTNCTLDDVYSPEEYEDAGDDRYPATYPSSDLESMSVYGCDSSLSAGQIAAFLGVLPPTVKHLALQSVAFSGDIVAAIARHPVLKQLETLSLARGNLTDETVKPLIAANQELGHLSVIDLSRNAMTATGIKTVAAALPAVRAPDQRKGDVPELFMRYVATME
jgi:predicted DNA-binding WGR domain protein